MIVVDLLILGASRDEDDLRVAFESVDRVKLAVDRSVDLCDLCDTLQFSGKLGPLGSKGLAVATPRGIQLQQPSLIRFVDSRLQVVSVQNYHILLRWTAILVLLTDGHSEKRQQKQKAYLPHLLPNY